MARNRTMSISVLNIEMEKPHSPERYVDLFEYAFSLRYPVKVYGDQSLIITSIEPKNGYVFGVIGKFTKIDEKADWLDIDSMDAADEISKKKIQIPPNLQPNYSPFYFHFNSKTHKMYFEKVVSPNSVRKFLSNIFSIESVSKKYGQVNVSIIQEEEALKEIFSLKLIKTLDITIFRPNPDDNGSLDEMMMEQMEEAGASQVRFGLTGSPKTGVQPTPQIRQLGQAALEHGEIEAKGYDRNDNLVVLSSVNHPVVKKYRYDPEISSERDAFRAAVGAEISSGDI